MKKETKSLRSLLEFQEDLQKKAAELNDSIRELASDAQELSKRVEEHAIEYDHTPHSIVVMRNDGKDVIVQLKKQDVISAFGDIIIPLMIDTSIEVKSL